MEVSYDETFLALCIWKNNTNWAIRLLEAKKTFDVGYRNGELFKIAIGHKNTRVFKALVDYYRKTKLTNHDSYKYTVNKIKLLNILKECVMTKSVSSEIEEVINEILTDEVKNSAGKQEEAEKMTIEIEDESGQEN
ncbi:unnamed protein product [Blepharisma stoltei]|uniref:Uncharacterized protein n=1 Tax=Blepharisma stoltei TaxID=1481888 RepID=A0AAU9JUX7_9CILI|nr:unnamed protein product [Blepharisma stoltei]